MSDEQWLRDALEESVPEPPSTDRLAGVRRRRRTTGRRKGLLAGAVAAVAVAAVAVPLAVRGGEAPVAREQAPLTAGGTPIPPDCPSPTAAPSGPDRIPADPVAVRLCAGGVPWLAPVDALTTDPGRIADAVNRQKVLDPGAVGPCTLELGRAYQLVFGYADGSTAVASGELYGCRMLMVGGTQRSGADAPWDAFVSALREQRAASSPPATLDPGTPSCQSAHDTGASPIAGPEDMIGGRLCTLVGDRWVEASATQADIRAIVDDFRRAQPMTTGSVVCLDHRQWMVVGTTAWADLVKVQAECGWYTGKGPHGADPAPISPEVKEIIATLLKQVTSR